MRHEYEALQEENVHLQSECERLSREAAEQQHRSAVSDEAEADASRDWRVVSNDQCKQPNVNVNVVNEGFVLSHYAEQLQERVAELERANRILQQRFSHSPAGSDQDICEGVFIDEKHRLEALRPRTVTSESFVCDSPTERTLSLCSREDAEISPVPSPDGVSGVTHSPSYERLKVEFVAYKQKAQKESKKLKARLASAVRENYELMKSNSALGESPSPSPVLRSPVSPVADILLLQSIGTEQSGTADRKRSTSGRHCDEKDVQTDLCGISKKIYALEATADSRAVEKITHSLPSGSQTSRDGREIDPTTSVGCRCKELEMELLVVQSQCLTLVQQNASLTEHIGCLRREAENQEQLVVTEAPAAAATDVLATDDTNDSTNHNLMAENRRLQQQRKMERSEYQEKMQLLEERCIQENAKLKQLLNAVKAGSDRSDEVSDGDTLSSCRHCAELADKCRMLETSVELSSLNAERRLHEAEESRVVAAHLQSRLDEFSEDDRSMVSEMHATSAYSLSSYVVDDHVVTNTYVSDRQDTICDYLLDCKTVSSIDHSVPVCTVDHDLVQRHSDSPGTDTDLEVAEIFESKHESAICTLVSSDLKLYKSVEDDDFSSCFSLCQDLNDRDFKSLGFQHSGEFSDADSLQAQYETSALHKSRQPAITETHTAKYETERTETRADLSGQQHLVTELPSAIHQETLQQSDAVETTAIKQKPQKMASERKMKKTFPITSTKSTSSQRKPSTGKTLGNSRHITPSVKNVNGSSLEKQLCSLSSLDTVKSCKRDDFSHSDATTSQVQEDEATTIPKSSIVDTESPEEAPLGKEDLITSTSPSQVTSSAVMLENVRRLVSQNEEILRRNRAWTDKLKREYAVAASELTAMKNKYEALVSEKEKVRTNLLMAQQDIKPHGYGSMKQAVAGKKASGQKGTTDAAGQQRRDDISIFETRRVSCPEIAEMKVQYEILLNEKNELCRKFEVERRELLKKLEEKDNGVIRETEITTLEDGDVGNKMPEFAVRLHEMSCQLRDEPSLYHAAQSENANLEKQLSSGGLNASFDDFMCILQPTVCDSHAENLLSEPAQSSVSVSSSGHREKLCADDTAKPSVQFFESENARSIATAATVREMTPTTSNTETAPQFDFDVKHVQISAVGLSHQDKVRTQSCGGSTIDPQSNSEVTDESYSVKVHSTSNSLLAAVPNMSAELSSNIHVELELLRLEKKELCTSLEMEEQKSAELQQQMSELAICMAALEVRSSELEGQLTSCKIHVEMVLEEKRELCRYCEELSAQLEAATVRQSEPGSLTQQQTLIQDSSIDSDTSANVTGSTMYDDVMNSDADSSLPTQLDSQELANEILELKAALERTTAEKVTLQEKLERCQGENQCLTKNVEQLSGRLDCITKSSEDAAHVAADEIQKLITANSALEVTNSLLTNELEVLKSRCCSLQDDFSRLSDETGSLQLELKSTNHAKELLSQHCDELLSKVESMQQHIACLEQENADFRMTLPCVNKKNECLLVEIADLRRDCELLSEEKEKLNAAISVAESAKCLLEDQCGKLAEKLRQLELTETETRRQHSADLQNVRSALEHKQKEYDMLFEELDAAKLAAELKALKLHDSLKCNEWQLEQLTKAETVIRDIEIKLCEKQNEVLLVTDLHAAALSAMDEVTSRSVSLQSENDTISAALCELRTEKDQLVTESVTKVEALETELLRKTADIASLQERALEAESANKQLSSELHSVNTALCEIQHQLQEEKMYHEKQMSTAKEQLEEERASVKVVCDSHIAELEEITSECTSLELQLSAVKAENSDVSQELQRAREEIEKQQDLVSTLSSKYQQYKDDAKTQLVEVKSVRDGLADNLEECRQEKKKVEEKLDQLASEFESCKREMAALFTEIDVFKQCNDDLKLRIAQSQKNEENLAGELQELRAEHAKSYAIHRTEMDEQKQVVLKAEAERDKLHEIHEQSCQVIDETITKYTEVEAQLSQLRQTNNVLMNDLDKTNQRCEVVSGENGRLISENRQLVDSLSCKTAEIGLLVVERKEAEAKIVKLSLELESLHEQFSKLVSKEAALQEEATQLKSTNSQLHLELENNRQLSQKLDDGRKYTEEIESELDELKVAHRMSLDREEILTKEIRALTATLQSDSQTHQLECQDLKSQIAEMEEVLYATRGDISSLQTQRQDVENICKYLHDCIANCVLEVSRDITGEDMNNETKGALHKELSEDDDVEQLRWLQVQIGKKNDKLQSLSDELKACHERLSSEELLHLKDTELMQKLEEQYKQLEDELTAIRRQRDEAAEQHAAAISELHRHLDELKHENECLSKNHQTMSDLHASSQQNVLILDEEITMLKSALQHLEDVSIEKEKCWKMRDSEFNSLTENYNFVVNEKNALETENHSLSNQMETLHKDRADLATQLKMANLSNSALEEKLSQADVDLQQSLQECTALHIKISELEGSLSREDCKNKKLADSVEKYELLFNKISQSITSISQKCQSDYPDATSAEEADVPHTECEGDVLNQYSHILLSLNLLSNCYTRMAKEQNQQKEKVSALVAECDFLKVQASVDVNVDVDLQELQDEVARLFQAKTDLENEVMQLHAENVDAKNAREDREVEIAAERAAWEQKSTDLHHLLDMASQSKEALETELLCERNEFERNLAAARCESLGRAGRSEEEQRKVIEQLSDAESQLAGLRDRLRASQDERDLLQLRLAYVARECTTKEQHLDDLRAQVAAQHSHIEEAMKEHRETIQLLVELRLEQQLGRREQHGEFSRLEEEILRLESHIESCSSRVGTPQTMSLLNTPVSHQPSSVHSLPVDCVSMTVTETAVKSDHDRTLQPSPDDLAYKALETKHFQLVQELSELKQQLLDLQEANKCLSDENAVLKQHVELKTVPADSSFPGSASLCNIHEHRSSLDFSRGPCRVQSCEQFSSIGSTTSLASFDQRAVGLNIPVEMVRLQAKLVQQQKDYQELVDENTELRTSLLAKQDELMKQMEIVREKQKKRSFRFGSSSSENVAAMTEVSGQQMQLLQKERDELRCRLHARRAREDEAAKLTDRVEQLEDALSKERQKFHDLYQEKESIEIQLLQERLTVEKHVREFQHLQGLMSKKERLEQQIEQTSLAADPYFASSAGTRQLLQEKKTQLVVEIRRKILYRDVALQVGDSSLRSRRTQMMSVQPTMKRLAPMAAEKSVRLDCGCITELGTMRMRAGCRYHQAVERLRRELKAQDVAARKSQWGKHADFR